MELFGEYFNQIWSSCDQFWTQEPAQREQTDGQIVSFCNMAPYRSAMSKVEYNSQ